MSSTGKMHVMLLLTCFGVLLQAQGDISKLREAKADLEASLSTVQDSLAAADQAAQSHSIEQSAAEAQLSSLQFELQTSTAAAASLTAKLEAHQAKIAALEAACKRAEDASAAADREHAEQVASHEDAAANLAAGHATATVQLESELLDVQQAAAQTRADLADSCAEVTALRQVRPDSAVSHIKITARMPGGGTVCQSRHAGRVWITQSMCCTLSTSSRGGDSAAPH